MTKTNQEESVILDYDGDAAQELSMDVVSEKQQQLQRKRQPIAATDPSPNSQTPNRKRRVSSAAPLIEDPILCVSLPQALPVATDYHPLQDGPPVDGEQFLQWVRQESQAMPGVHHAKLKPAQRRLFDARTATCPTWSYALSVTSSLEPATATTTIALNQEWRQACLKRFRKLRQQRCSVAEKEQHRQQEQDVYGKPIAWWIKTLYSKESLADLVPSLAYLSQPDLLQLLALHVEKLVSRRRPFAWDVDRMARVLFTLLVHLDQVLTGQDIAMLRQLGRQLLDMLEQEDAPEWKRWEPQLHPLLAILADFYGQKDLLLTNGCSI